MMKTCVNLIETFIFIIIKIKLNNLFHYQVIQLMDKMMIVELTKLS